MSQEPEMEDSAVAVTKILSTASQSITNADAGRYGGSQYVMTLCKRRSETKGISELTSIRFQRDIPGVMVTMFKKNAGGGEQSSERTRKVISQVRVLSAKRISYVIPALPGLLRNAMSHGQERNALQIPYVPVLTSAIVSEGHLPSMVSEMEQLRGTLEVAGRSLHLLRDAPAQDHPIKAFHNNYMNRQFAVLTMLKATEGGSQRFIGFLWQTVGGKSPRLVCVTFSYSNGEMSLSCSCDPLSVLHCDHAQACLETELAKFGREALDNIGPLQEYFGHCSSREPSDFTVVELVRKNFLAGRIASQGTSQEWSCWMVFDSERNLFVPVTKRFKKKFQCQACRGSSYKRADCHHEIVCINMSTHRDHANCETDDHADDEPEQSPTTGGAGDLADIEKYCCQEKRPLLPCPTEKERMRDLTLRISYSVESSREMALKDGVDPATRPVLNLRDMVRICRNPQCSERNSKGSSRKRPAYLFTLGSGTLFITVTDWTCSHCQKDFVYTGIYDAVFPVRKESLYTTELMYALATNVFRWGISLRAAYGTLNTYMKSASNIRELSHSEQFIESKRSRRRVAEAFRIFMSTLQTEDDSESNTPSFLSLFSCDVCEVEMNSDDRRMLGLGEGDLPSFKRYTGIVIDGTSAGISAELPHYERRQEILSAPKRMKDSKVVQAKETKNALNALCSISQEFLKKLRRKSFSSRGLSFPLQPRLTKKQVDILRYSINTYSCNCAHETGTENMADVRHTRRCKGFHRLLISSDEIKSILRSVFDISQASTSATAEDRSLNNESQSDTEDSENEIDQINFSEGGNESSALQWRARVVFSNASRYGQLLDALLDLVKFVSNENCAMVYIVPASQNPATIEPDATDQPGDSFDSYEFSSPGRPHHKTANLSGPSIRLHKDLCDALEGLSGCTHSPTGTVCKECIDCLCEKAQSLINVNVVLYRFCYELIPAVKATPSTSVLQLCVLVARLCRMHISFAQKYFLQLDEKISEGCGEYTRSYGSVMLEEMDNYSNESGICFPDLSMYRPHILFEVKEKHHCTKKYPKSLRFSPGILSVECVCKHPKCLGFIIMTKAESTALALSAIVSHFRIPPRAVYYDNGCNLFASALTRVPWLLHITRIAVDRFHFKGHKCSSFFDADFYTLNDGQRTSAAEAINAKLKKAISSMRYLTPESMMDYLKCRFAIANVESMFRDTYRRADLEDDDLSVFFHKRLSCRCVLCQLYSLENSESQTQT